MLPPGGTVFGRRTLMPMFVLAVALLVVVPAVAGSHTAAAGPAAESATDQIVVRLADGAAFDATSLGATAGVSLQRVRVLDDGSIVVKLPNRHALGLVRAITQKLEARADIVLAEPDAIMQPLATPNDTRWVEQWNMLDPSSGFYGASLPGAWDITTGSAGITVGVIDTGYRPHADLSGRIVPGYDFIGDTIVANDGNGRDPDALDPGDWVTSAESASGWLAGCPTGNSSWHGTHVAGTIGAATNNALGVAGINWVSQIQPLRVLGKCGGYTTDIADAIRWGAGLSVSGLPANPTPNDVVNLSLGGSGGCTSTYQNAINAAVTAGTVVVVAAGNSNANAANYSPASCANVITVASTGHTGSRAYYSNYGTSVEIAAPGGDAQLGKTILSTLNTGTTTPAADSYANYQGTSMATPHVVGVVSLLLSVNPSLTPSQVTSMLQATATPFPSGSSCSTSTCGAGILNAAAAVAQANGGGGGTPTLPGAFSKLSPSNGQKNRSRPVTLQWATSTGAVSYAYCISTSGTCTAFISTGGATSVTLTDLAARAQYYWQAQATNADGSTLANGGTLWSFRTR